MLRSQFVLLNKIFSIILMSRFTFRLKKVDVQLTRDFR